MNSSRREFLKTAGLAGLAAGSLPLAGCATAAAPAGAPASGNLGHILDAARQPHSRAAHNMCGFVAPKLEVVRIGLIGVGQRGIGAAKRLPQVDGAEVVAVSDVRPERLELAAAAFKGRKPPVRYTGAEEAWKQLCERDDVDLVYLCTPWHLHTPMAVYAMEHGKHVAVEVPAATTVEECWQLVETSERTQRHCRMLENCCYDFFELQTLAMARQGAFGEIIHCEGAYLHDLLSLNFSKTGYYEMWRLKQNFRHGNLYPTHGLGPVCQILNVNRGDRIEYLSSLSGADFTMAPHAEELAAKDPFFAPYRGKHYRGNLNLTTMRTANGKTILLQHDVSTARPYSRIHHVCGTKGQATKYPLPARIAFGEKTCSEAELQELERSYTYPFIARIAQRAKEVGGHGGMDFIMDSRIVDCLRRGRPMDHDVYDAATWSVIAPLTEWSVANRSNSIDVPDFTRGAWTSNPPVDLTA